MSESARVFVQLGAYADIGAAEADQKTVNELHASDMVGRFETTVITRDGKGQVQVVKGESTARRWATRGLVVGAVIGVMFPPSILLSAGAGAVMGGLGAKDNGLELKAIPAGDLDALGRLINPGEAALVIVGEQSAHSAIDLAKLTPLRQRVKTGQGTYAELEQEIMSALAAGNDDAAQT